MKPPSPPRMLMAPRAVVIRKKRRRKLATWTEIERMIRRIKRETGKHGREP